MYPYSCTANCAAFFVSKNMSTNKYTTNNNHTLVAVSNADGETPVYLYADPTTHALIGGGGAATIADGADVTLGAIADAAVAAGATGTVSAKLRRLTTDLDAVKTNTTGIATAAKQDTGNASLASIDGKIVTVNTGAVVISSGTVSATQSGTWTVGSNSAIGASSPANAFYAGMNNSGNNLVGLKTAASASDGTSGDNVLAVETFTFNGTNQDRKRGNENVTLLSSAARTTTQTSADLVNYNGLTYIDVILDVTVAGTGSITLSIDGKDPASSKYYNLLTGAAVTTISTNIYRVGVGLTAAANATANLPLPRTFRIVVTANNANSMTYSVGYALIRS